MSLGDNVAPFPGQIWIGHSLGSMDNVLEDVLTDLRPINSHELGYELDEMGGTVKIPLIEDFFERNQIVFDIAVAFDLLQPIKEYRDRVRFVFEYIQQTVDMK